MKLYTMLLTGLIALSFVQDGTASQGKKQPGKSGAPGKLSVVNKPRTQPKGKPSNLAQQPSNMAQLRKLVSDESKEAPGEVAALERKNRFDEANKIAETTSKIISPEDMKRLTEHRDNVAGNCTSPRSPAELKFWSSAACGEKLKAYELAIVEAQRGQPVPDAQSFGRPAEAQLTSLKNENLRKLSSLEEQQKKILDDPRITKSGPKFESLVQVVTAALNSCKEATPQDATDYLATPGCKDALDRALAAQINFRTGK